jgi:hypothetical protein
MEGRLQRWVSGDDDYRNAFGDIWKFSYELHIQVAWHLDIRQDKVIGIILQKFLRGVSI